MLVVSSDWLFHTLIWVRFSLRIKVGSEDAWMTVSHFGLFFIPVGMVSTFFLRGLPRLLVIASWLLMSVYLGHFYIT